MIKSLLAKIGVTSPRKHPATGLTEADVEALAQYVAECDDLEPGLGQAVLAYLLSGEGESLLLRLRALPRHDDVLSGHLPAEVWIYGGASGAVLDQAATARNAPRIAARRRVLLALEGWDAEVIQRLGAVLAEVNGTRLSQYYPGTDAAPVWLCAVLEAVHSCRNSHREHDPARFGMLDAARCLEMLRLAGGGADALVDICFGGEGYYARSATTLRKMLPGLAAALAGSAGELIAGLRRLPVAEQAVALAWVGDHIGLSDPALFDTAVSLLTSGGKQVGAAALTALHRCEPGRVRERGAALLDSPVTRDRLAAIQMLGGVVGRDAAPLLAARDAVETTRAVEQALKEALLALEGNTAERRDDATGYVSADGDWVAIPPYDLPPDTPFPADAAAILRAAATEADRLARESYAAFLADRAARLARGEKYVQNHYEYENPFALSGVPHVIRVASGAAEPGQSDYPARSMVGGSYYLSQAAQSHFRTALASILDRPEVTAHHLARLAAFHIASDGNNASAPYNRSNWARLLLAWAGHGMVEGRLFQRVTAGLDARAAIDMGAPWAPSQDAVIAAMVDTSRYGAAEEERDETLVAALWPLLAQHMTALDCRFGLASGDTSPYEMLRALDLLSLLPALPRRYLPGVLDVAMGGHPNTAPAARALLRSTTSAVPMLTGMLTSSEPTRRARAASLLARMGGPAHIPALRAALDLEKAEVVRAALLNALVSLGEDISDQFSEDRMLQQATAGLAKTGAKLMTWFPADALPPVAWQDGRAVPPQVVRWWLVLADKVKLPGGDPLMRMTLDRLDRASAGRLGTLALSAFIAQDTRQSTAAEAADHAEQNADRLLAARSWQKDFTREMAYEELRRAKLATYLGSANDHRGILALARHVPGADAVQMVRAYFRDHYVHTAQCKALLECLAANPSPAALQLVLATANRHRTAGVQKLAGELVERISEDNGWTRDELGDRTVPTGGLDADGVLDLPIGSRVFRVVLDTSGPDFAVTLQNPAGKAVKALPALPKDASPEETEDAATAKKAFANLRKEIKQTAELQKVRLYEAMCAGRIWKPADFDAYLLRHPVVAPLCRRLVFAGTDAEGAILATFRPLSDGTMSGPADETVTLDGFAGVKVAHRAMLPEDTAAAWRTHLADYDVVPLFDQFGRPNLDLAALPNGATEIEDRKGWMIETFKLRGAATKLGYGRGQAEDGGVFWVYEKPFASLGLVARIGFSGASLPETSMPAALLSLGFSRFGARWGGKPVALQQVPPVLLNEAWCDFHAVADAGTGFDADWQKKLPW